MGPLDGLLGGRFIVAFLSVLCIILGKGGYIATVVAAYPTGGYSDALLTAKILVGFQFIPQIILALFTTIGFTSSSMKLIFYHPETVLLPSGTHFKNI